MKCKRANGSEIMKRKGKRRKIMALDRIVLGRVIHYILLRNVRGPLNLSS